MKKIILFAIISITFVACQTKTVDSQLFVRGRLFLTDKVSQNDLGSPPLADVMVYLSEDSTNNPNFMQSVKSDANGYFVFSVDPSHARDYYVYSEFKKNDLVFKGIKHVTMDSDVVLDLQFDAGAQNGLKLELRDTSHGYLSNTNVYFYSSQLVAQLDDTLGTNAYKKLVTDSYGAVRLFNIGQGSYYVNSRKRFGGVVISRKLKLVTVGSAGIAADSMLLN